MTCFACMHLPCALDYNQSSFFGHLKYLLCYICCRFCCSLDQVCLEKEFWNLRLFKGCIKITWTNNDCSFYLVDRRVLRWLDIIHEGSALMPYRSTSHLQQFNYCQYFFFFFLNTGVVQKKWSTVKSHFRCLCVCVCVF